MFFNMAFLIELSLVIAFAGFSYGVGAMLAAGSHPKPRPRHVSLLLAGAAGIVLGLLLTWLSHSVLLVLFPNDRAFVQTGDLMNMGLLAIAAYLGAAGSEVTAA